jgi:hypothetical protein
MTWERAAPEQERYREALGQMLAQFLHGEEVAYEVIPLELERVDDPEMLTRLQAQLDEEKRHHQTFTAERQRLNLPTVPPAPALVRFGERVIDAKRRGDLTAAVFTGSYMLEGIAFSTLQAYSDVVEPTLGAHLAEIMADEGRHITLNIELLRQSIDADPSLIERVVEIHRDALPDMFEIYVTATPIHEILGVDYELLAFKTLDHHRQRLHRLHLPPAASRSMLEDYLKFATRLRERFAAAADGK